MNDMKIDFDVKKLADGLGFGDGSIGVDAASDAEVMRLVDEAVHSPSLLVPVSVDDVTGQPVEDDGCGDGRIYKTVFAELNDGVHTFKRSLHRPKVFGGGATMAVSSLIGSGNAESDAEQEIFAHAMATMRQRQIDFGAHTDESADDAHCGCGAIDKFPAILAATVTYRDNITDSIAALNVSTDGLDKVLDNFAHYAEKHSGEQYNGHVVADAIVHAGKVVKELAGGHIEKAIVLNTVANYTVDQEFVHAQTNGQADVFAVDVWRMQQIADKLYDSEDERQTGFLSELVYSMATAAVLTRGNLPVYICSK